MRSRWVLRLASIGIPLSLEPLPTVNIPSAEGRLIRPWKSARQAASTIFMLAILCRIHSPLSSPQPHTVTPPQLPIRSFRREATSARARFIATPITSTSRTHGRPAPVWETGVMEEAVFYPQPPYRYSTDWGGWAPRVNLDWRAMKQTVFHAGGAITTLLTNLYQDNFLTGGFPMVISPYITTTPGFPIPFVNGPLPIQLPGLFTAQGAPLFVSSNPMTVPPNTVMDVQRFEEDVAAQAPGSGTHPVTLFGIARNFQNGYIATYTAGLEHHFGDVTFNADYVATMGIKLASVMFPNSYPGAAPAFAPFTRFNAAGQAAGGF